MRKAKSIPKPQPEPYFQVEKLLNKKAVKGKVKYLVKWKGYSDEQATWQDAENLSSILDVILEYENQTQEGNNCEPCKLINGLQNTGKTVSLKLNSQFQDGKPQLQRIDEVVSSIEESSNIVSKSEETLHVSGQEQPKCSNSKLCANEVNEAQANEDKTGVAHVEGSTSMDISFQAKKIQSKFSKIAQKCKLTKASKKQQIQSKKQRKVEQEKYGGYKHTPTRKSARKPTEILEYAPLILDQKLLLREQSKERNISTRSNNVRKNRQKKSQIVREKVLPTDILDNENKKVQKDQTKIDSREDCSPSEIVLPHTTESLEKIINSNYESALKAIEQSKAHTIVDIRKIESLANEQGEYMVEYGDGSIKRMKIIEVMLNYPLDFAGYLEKRHRI